MRAPAVQGAARRGKQLVEIDRCRHLRDFRPPVDPQAAPLQHAKCLLCALFHLRCPVRMPVAIRRRVDQNQKFFLGGRHAGIVVAILRADIDRRLPRQPVAAEDVVELGGVVTREKYIVTPQRKPVRLRNDAPGQRRQ